MHLFRLPSPSLLRSSPPVPFFNPRWQVSKKIQIDPVSSDPSEAREKAQSSPWSANMGQASKGDLTADLLADIEQLERDTSKQFLHTRFVKILASCRVYLGQLLLGDGSIFEGFLWVSQ